MTVHLVVAEHDGKTVKKTTLHALAAAKKLPGTCYGVVIGNGAKQAADAFAAYVGKVFLVENEQLAHRIAQPFAKVISDVAKNVNATHVWAPATVAGKDMMPRVAVRLNAGMASDICAVVDEKTFMRPMWAGDVIGTVEIATPVKVVTVRTTEFAVAQAMGGGEVVEMAVELPASSATFVRFDEVKSERPDLADARVVVSGGRGLKGPEGFKKLVEPLADALHAAIGASRAVCDAGWVPNDWQVGQTGKVVAPELYIAVGISGAIQHVAGMKSSKVIVAINKDPEAPIFKVATYGLVADAFTVVPELIERIKAIH
jgi:electron transfer flavoprotein alpha subunit